MEGRRTQSERDLRVRTEGSLEVAEQSLAQLRSARAILQGQDPSGLSAAVRVASSAAAREAEAHLGEHFAGEPTVARLLERLKAERSALGQAVASRLEWLALGASSLEEGASRLEAEDRVLYPAPFAQKLDLAAGVTAAWCAAGLAAVERLGLPAGVLVGAAFALPVGALLWRRLHARPRILVTQRRFVIHGRALSLSDIDVVRVLRDRGQWGLRVELKGGATHTFEDTSLPYHLRAVLEAAGLTVQHPDETGRGAARPRES